MEDDVSDLPIPITRADEYLYDIAASLRMLTDGQTVPEGQVELREPARQVEVDLDGMTRDQLDRHARSVGVSDPKALPNKDAVKTAIREAG